MEKICAILYYLRYRWFIKSSGFFFIKSFASIKGAKNIEIGNQFFANRFLRIEAIANNNDIKLKIGNNVNMGENVHIAAVNKIIINDNVLIGSRILITDHNHGKYNGDGISNPDESPNKREIYSAGIVVIEENVWIGDGVCILANVTIGKSSIIGANTVVAENVPPYSIVGGIPGKVIKNYNFTTKNWEKI
ncbi:acetyltransferase [Halpernia sp.]|uniref:acetyltransferase n=1 Tax=Halpernia sp. TaxID=2782209 RepID=UPI003A90F2DF